MTDPDSAHKAAGRRPSWLPHLGRGATWLLAAIATAAIGFLVPVVLGGWLTGADDEPSGTITRPQVAESRLVGPDRIGLWKLEENPSVAEATERLGQPDERTPEDSRRCRLGWHDDDLIIRFYTLAVADPCFDGSFCEAHISGREWSTAEGLSPGMSARRVLELHPRAERVFDGELTRYVLDPGTALCGPEAEGGLEAWAGGRVISRLYVNLRSSGG
jgi:hypothetical protein